MAAIKLGILENSLKRTTTLAMWFSCCAVVLMLFALVADVFLRTFVNIIMPGTVEIVEILMVVVVFMTLAYTYMQNGHVAVEFFYKRSSRRGQAFFDGIGALAGLLVFSLFFNFYINQIIISCT